jgi:hypothetical protein
MKASTAALHGALVTSIWANSFEPTNFNVTEALIQNGVDVSSIPGLAGLVERSSISACSVAVRSIFLACASAKVRLLILFVVQ